MIESTSDSIQKQSVASRYAWQEIPTCDVLANDQLEQRVEDRL